MRTQRTEGLKRPTLSQPVTAAYTQEETTEAYEEMRELSVAQFYCARAWNLNALDSVAEGGFTKLSMAAHIGHQEVVLDLIARGASLEVRSKGAWTALHAAVHGMHAHVVSALVAAGANVNAAADLGLTPLIQACILGASPAVVQPILAAPLLDRTKRDMYGADALTYATQRSDGRLLALLAPR